MKRVLFLFALCFAIMVVGSSSHTGAQDASLASKFLGKWTNQNETKGLPTMVITSVDSATGLLIGKYTPPSGPAAGKEFEVVGFVSSAPPIANADNAIVVSFSVSLTTYGSIATWTGFLKDGNIVASSSNVRSNTGYEWNHITATYDVWTKNP